MNPYLQRLETLVNIDSGSGDAEGLRRVAATLGGWCQQAGMTVDDGTVFTARLRGHETRKLLLVGHLDTVFPAGTASSRPFRVAGGRAYGPGVCDDKGGVLAGLAAMESLVVQGFTRYQEIVLVALWTKRSAR